MALPRSGGMGGRALVPANAGQARADRRAPARREHERIGPTRTDRPGPVRSTRESPPSISCSLRFRWSGSRP